MHMKGIKLHRWVDVPNRMISDLVLLIPSVW